MRIQPGISVIIPARVASREGLVSTIQAIQSALVREVIIVDDASPEDIESWVHELFDDTDFRLFVHRLNSNLGPSIARNIGAQISTCEHLLFLDADVVLHEETLALLHKEILKRPDDVIQPFPETTHQEKSLEKQDHNALLTDPFVNIDNVGTLPKLYSFCFLIRRECFFGHRGFSAFFTITHEDVEFGDRLAESGVQFVCLRAATITHDHPFDVDQYYARSRINGESYARLADVTGDPEYARYLKSIDAENFPEGFDAIDSAYRTSRASATFDASTFDRITRYLWKEGVERYRSEPVISVAIPVGNQEDRLVKTLRSLKRQRFTNFEVHLVFARDIEPPEIEWRGYQRIHVHRQLEGKLPHAMNIALHAAGGKLFTWIQCGDYVDKDYLRLLANEFFLDQSTAISFCGYKNFGLSDDVAGWIAREPSMRNQDQLNSELCAWNVIGPGFMVKTRNDVAYNEQNSLSEDWEFFLLNALKGRIRYVDRVLYHYMDHDDSLTRLVGWRAPDSSALERDQRLAQECFSAALGAQRVCAGYVIRNESWFIEESLLSVLPWVDEVCIIDTGSTDETLAIIERIQREHPRGDRISLHHRTIYHYNVSRFRNEIAELAEADWIMIVDGDEVWPTEQISKLVDSLKLPAHYQTESINVFQKRWSSMLEQQTSFAPIGTIIRAYRRSHRFLWRQSETIDFFIGDRRLEQRHLVDPSRQEAQDACNAWLSRLTTDVELQSVEFPYRNYDGQLPDVTWDLDVYFDHFSRCKGDLYQNDRVRRIHQKLLGTTEHIRSDKAWNGNLEAFIPIHQHAHIKPGVSLVIPHFNNQKGLAKCIESLGRFPPGVPFEVLVVNDNPEIAVHLPALEHALVYRVIDQPERAGFAAAVNTGLCAARHTHICVCNDDIEFVSEGWAAQMIDCMASDSMIAVAGPVTNRTGGYPPVQYEGFETTDYEDIPGVVESIWDATVLEVTQHTVLSGFCYLLKREHVIDAGLFDAAGYPWGYGEENAYTHRLLKMGLRAILVRSVFVWHGLGETFDNGEVNPVVDLVEVKRRNIRKAVDLTRPRLVAYGRAKNEALLIEEQLRRMLGLCDHVVILDTGSTDDTVRIARGFDRVTVVETQDRIDYNAAIQLNLALQIARSKDPDWLLYFDMDQFFDNSIYDEIDELLGANDIDIWSFRLYDGRFVEDDDPRQFNTQFTYHNRRLCEPCFRVQPALYRNRPDLIVAEPVSWEDFSEGDYSEGVSYPPEHCVLPIQYMDIELKGSYSRRCIARSIIRHLGSCLDLEDLERKKVFYENFEGFKHYADDWKRYPLMLPRNKLMRWHEYLGVEVDIGSNVIKYLEWDSDPAKRQEFVW